MYNTKPPYYAVIFTSLRNEQLNDGYEAMADKMVELAETQPGFIAVDSARDGIGITVSYWESLEAIQQWKLHTDHLLAQALGKQQWYLHYSVRICKVEREYEFGG